MSTAPITSAATSSEATLTTSRPATGWPLWRRQLFAIFRMESRKSTFTPRALLLYLLAAAPIVLVGGVSLINLYLGQEITAGKLVEVFSVLFQVFYLRGVIFFGCVWVFTNLFRGEVLDQSLHYYFLSPVRRGILVAGKYLAGLVATTTLFGVGVIITYFLLHLPVGWSATQEHFFNGPGLGHLASYVTITLLACMGYGAVFLLFGILFRNPIVPVAAVLLWEGINFLLPPLLKKISVVHYLNSWMPVPMPQGPFAIVTDPTPIWISTLGLLAMTAVFLGLATLKLKRTQVSYGDE